MRRVVKAEKPQATVIYMGLTVSIDHLNIIGVLGDPGDSPVNGLKQW